MRDSFSIFLNEAGRIPLLTHSEEIMLAREVQRWLEIRNEDSTNDKALQRRQKRGERAYNRFFEGNIRMVITLARKYSKVAKELTIEDLTMEGMVGLSRAIELFDPARGYKFSTYAYNWIRQSITRSISYYDRSIRIPVNGIERLSELSDWVPKFIDENHRAPTINEMAKHVGCMAVTLEAYLQHTRRVISLDIPTGEEKSRPGDGGLSSLAELIPDDAPSPEDEFAELELCREVQEVLDELPPRESSVLRQRFGFDNEPMKLVDIASEDGIHRSLIWDRQDRGMKRLRQTLLPYWREFTD